MKDILFYKLCPTCGESISNKTHSGLLRSVRNNSNCKRCSNKGENNPSFGKRGVNGFHYGKKHSEESNLKNSASCMGRKGYWEGKTRDAATIKKIADKRRLYSELSMYNSKNQRRKFIRWVRGADNGFEQYVGCSIKFFREWIESKFEEGMNWNNHTPKGWHLDHCKPLSRFDLTLEGKCKEAWHFSNLRPIWGIQNLKKGTNILNEFYDVFGEAEIIIGIF